MKKQLITVIAFVACGVLGTGLGWTQQAANRPAATDFPASDPSRTSGTLTLSSGSSSGSLYPPSASPFVVQNTINIAENAATSPIRSEIKQIVQQLRQDGDEAAKADLVKHLETAVSQYFDEDLKLREDQLSKLEERVTKLRGQLERRRKAKADIVQLQTKVFTNDADGLGFSGTSLIDDSTVESGLFTKKKTGTSTINAPATTAAPSP